MNRLRVDRTPSTPLVDFDPESGLLRIEGESFPENAAKFYAPMLEWIRAYLALEETPPVTLECELLYFNSSTSKILMNLFDALEERALAGRSVAVRWICRADNETAIECGEEFGEDLESLPFEIVRRDG
jgi:hypothetical protein